jgi:hypothetical protein
MVMAVSKDRSAGAIVSSLSISTRTAPAEAQSFLHTGVPAGSKYSYSELAAWLNSGWPMSKEALKDYAKISLPGNLHFGDSRESIVSALGPPDEYKPSPMESAFFYFGRKTSVAFIPASAVEGIVITPRPKDISPKTRLRMWGLYVLSMLNREHAPQAVSESGGTP